ncbi:hypothetical protein [Rhodopirellula sp. P2]|uniref:hypothetical protein n=1 Tax=Rhodopirellula sp. P2 TaxID=2127060 RepID=UPI002368471F|nr:hypothetical protein [Rhodopirellula sp. P2]WDQ17119.1 hypothetical protein PSR62_00870 [Rhodopirellula sp. P2]
MGTSKLTSRIPIFQLFIGGSLLVGWLIPSFYAWTDSDQSRPSSLLWKVPLGSSIASLAFCLVLPWLPIRRQASSDAPRTSMRFSVRTLLILTAGVAIAIPLLAKFPLGVSAIVCAGAFAYFIAFCVRNPQHRMAAATLFACMALPYAWVVGYKELGRIFLDLVVMFAGMPAFLPAAMLSQVFGQHFLESQWLAFLLTALELVLGIWMICLGPKRTIAYLLLVMQMSAVGSLGFYMLCIA